MLALQASHLTKFHVLAEHTVHTVTSPASKTELLVRTDAGHYSEGTITVNGVLQIATTQERL